MWGIPAGIIATNIIEWLFHKHVLHGLGKKKNSMWSDHWRTHHNVSRKNVMIDKDYFDSFPTILNTSEIKAILAGASFLLPLIKRFPYFVTTMWVCGVAYFVIHRRAHLDSEWAKKYVPWHFDHHMGKNQDRNWNVTFPLMDYIMGTRAVHT